MASLVQRGPVYYIQFYTSGKLKRVSTATEVLQIAKEKLRQFESAQARGDTLPLPTRTPIAEVVTAYVEHIRTIKTPKSAQTDIYYLRDMFGPICNALEITSRKVGVKSKKRPPKPGQDRRRKAPVIEANSFDIAGLNWPRITKAAAGVSHAEVTRACDDAAKEAILEDRNDIDTGTLGEPLSLRRNMTALARARRKAGEGATWRGTP